MNNTKKYTFWLFLLISAVLIAADQLTKNYIVSHYELHSGVSFIDGFFSFYYVRNTGSAFSFLADRSWGIYVLTGISLILSGVVLFFLYKAAKVNEMLASCALMLLFAGAAGNLIDRFRLRYVVDFIRFDFGSKTFPIFNVADICAVIGTCLLVVILIFMPQKAEKIW